MNRISFNKEWKVWRDTNPFELVFRVPEDALPVDLPYDAMFHERPRRRTVSIKAPQAFWMAVYINIIRSFLSRKIIGAKIYFSDSRASTKAVVFFINQSLAGQYAGGYTDFYVKANDYLKYGETNMLMVTARCGPAQTSRW